MESHTAIHAGIALSIQRQVTGRKEHENITLVGQHITRTYDHNNNRTLNKNAHRRNTA